MRFIAAESSFGIGHKRMSAYKMQRMYGQESSTLSGWFVSPWAVGYTCAHHLLAMWECRIVANTSAFQAEDAGSIPVIPSKYNADERGCTRCVTAFCLSMSVGKSHVELWICVLWGRMVIVANVAMSNHSRGVAQFGSAPALGAGGRRFKSCRPDINKPARNSGLVYIFVLFTRLNTGVIREDFRRQAQ